MNVSRIKSGRTSYVEPPLDKAWDELTQLEWKAAVVMLDTGLEGLTVREIKPGRFCVSAPGKGMGDQSFPWAWRSLSDIAFGASAMARQQEAP